MIKYLKHSEIDLRKWDVCINRSFNGNAYANSWYLDIVHPSWEALVENDYERVMPLTGGSKMGVSYLFQPYFTQQLGVFSQSVLNPKIVLEFIGHIPRHFKFIEINLNSLNKLDDPRFKAIPNKNHILDLINEYPKIAAKYSSNTKRNIKKSQKTTQTLMKNIKPEAVVKLFRENRGKEIGKWDDGHYAILTRLMYTAVYKGKGIVYGVFDGRNQLTAAAFFLKSNNRLIFLFSGADSFARESSAMTFLIDGVIQEFAPSQLVLDFEGSNNTDLARFYKGFGAKEVEYSSLRVNRLPFPLKQFLVVYKKLKKQE